MTPFRVEFEAGRPIFEQVVFAATRAFVSGKLRPGDKFPSVRTLAVDLKIHPNTAHKVVQHLIQERWLESRPGIGTVVAQPPAPRVGDQQRLLGTAIEKLIVDAKSLGLGLEDLSGALQAQWHEMSESNDAGSRDGRADEAVSPASDRSRDRPGRAPLRGSGAGRK